MLTSNTPIPTHARGALRAFIRGQSGFDAWVRARGIASRDVRNSDLIDYALAHGLESDVLAILNAPAPAFPVGGQPASPASQPYKGSYSGPCDSLDELHAMQALAENAMPVEPVADNAARDAQIESAIAVADILAPVDAFLSPLVKAELEKALAPVVAAANKPAVEKIVERFTVQNLSPLPAGALPYAMPKPGKSTLGAVFGIRGKEAGKPVTLWESHGASPAVDPYYVVDAFNMAMMATGFERGVNVWLAGPAGSGKSSLPEQYAANVGRPCVRLSFTRQTDVADLIGGPGLKASPEGSFSAWEDGALIQAVRRPGTVIILDELTMAPAGVQAVLQSLADDSRSYTLPTGEKVTCAPGVVFVVADNTNGFGDQTGQYHGTNPANAALVNRFKRMLEIEYMSKATEAQAIVNHCPGCPRPAADALADFMARARKLPEMENVVLSLRQMTGFIQIVQDGFSPKVAATSAFLNRLPAPERAALETLFTLAWAQDFANLMSGTPSPDVKPQASYGPSQPASQSAAAQAFDDGVSAQLNR